MPSQIKRPFFLSLDPTCFNAAARPRKLSHARPPLTTAHDRMMHWPTPALRPPRRRRAQLRTAGSSCPCAIRSVAILPRLSAASAAEGFGGGVSTHATVRD